MVKILFIFLALFFCSCVNLNNKIPLKENENFYILRSSDKTKISFQKFIDEILSSDIILLGEKHDNPNHHTFELMILQALDSNLSKNNKRLNIAFEMFSNHNQKNINQAKNNKNNISEKELSKALNWDKSWDWKMYKELINFAFYSDANILGANLSKSEINQIYNGVKPLNGVYSTKENIKKEIQKIISLLHEINDEKILKKLVEIQQFKDRRMADVLVNSKEKAVLIAGMFHVSKKIGIPLHIKDFKSRKKVSVVVFNFDINDLEYQDSDYIFVFGEDKNEKK